MNIETLSFTTRQGFLFLDGFILTKGWWTEMPSEQYINLLKNLAGIRGSSDDSWQNAVIQNFVRERLQESGAKYNSKTHQSMVKLAFDVWGFATHHFEKK